MPRLTGVKQGIHLLHRQWPVAKTSTGSSDTTRFNFAQSGYWKAISAGLKVAIISGGDFAADDSAQLHGALAAQGRDVTTTEISSIPSLSLGQRAEIVAFVSPARGSTVSEWIAPWPVYGRRCRA
jgi:hypothetical protein